jgi:biopolymer transport protein ExbD
MAGGMLDDDQDEITGINVTPLVDVMLVLLIIFMVTANYVSSSSLGLKLPEAETGATGNTAKNIELVIDADSNIYVDGKKTGKEEIVSVIKQAKEKFGEKKPQALITADVLTPHGEVVKLIDLVRKNGISEFALNVEVPTSSSK